MQSIAYVLNLLANEGQGSLFSFLKKNSLADVSTAGTTEDGISALKIGITLTPEGLQNVNGIVCHFFRFINLLKTTGPQEWYWKEMQLMKEIHNRHPESRFYLTEVSSLATRLLVS